MFNKLIQLYKDILDNKINHTILVLIIALFIVCAWIFVKKTNAYIPVKTNLLESWFSTINIDWTEYQIIIKK